MTVVERPLRDNPSHALPHDLPIDFRQFDTPVKVIREGGPGKIGLIELEVERFDDVSRIVRRYHRAPLQFFQPMYIDTALPGMPFIMVLQQGGGMLQGDRYRLDISCGEGAAIHVTSQSATKLYKCDDNFITQIVTITAGKDSVVEYLPDMTIPYRNSRFFQRLDLHIDPEATVIVGEVLTAGRIAMGERHDYDIYFAQTNAYAPDGRLLAVDTVKLQPPAGSVESPALFGPYDAFGVLSVFSRKLPLPQLTRVVREALAADTVVARKAIAGVSELPNASGISVRILGTSGAVAEHARRVAWSAARQALLNVPAPDLRKA